MSLTFSQGSSLWHVKQNNTNNNIKSTAFRFGFVLVPDGNVSRAHNTETLPVSKNTLPLNF